MDLTTPLTYVKGIGPGRAAMLEAKGLTTVEDLLGYVPFRYEDRSNMKPIAQLAPGENSYMVIVTRGHRDDMKILRWAVEQPTRYLGMIGSKRKVIAIYKELEKQGTERERLLRVAAPVGLAIGAVTPQEIAVAIVAEMIAVRRQAAASLPHMRYYDEPAGIVP